jgi:hypothetical protein
LIHDAASAGSWTESKAPRPRLTCKQVKSFVVNDSANGLRLTM